MRLKFPAYRRYREAGVTASDALMALLIGARLGHHALSKSPAAPDAHLPDLFGLIPGIERVNRTVADAARLLDESEHHLASMGIPYVLGVQAAYLVETIEMLRQDGKDDQSAPWRIQWTADPTKIPLSDLHEYVAERCGEAAPPELLQLFRLARRIRNRIVHSAGEAGPRLPGEYRALPKDARTRWERITQRPLAVDARGKLALAEGELVAVLAVNRHLATTINTMLARAISREYWAQLVVRDYASLEPQRYGERDTRIRRLTGHARVYYKDLGLTPEELQTAVAAVEG